MKFERLLRRIDRFPQAKITFYNQKGQETTTPFATLSQEVRALISSLEDLGIQAGMRLGIVGENSYAWMVWDLALTELGAVSVAFPESFALSRGPAQLIETYHLALLAVCEATQIPDAYELPGVVRLQDLSLENRKPLVHGDAQPLDPRIHSWVFSSGTTGKLKGLNINREGTENLVTMYGEAFPFQKEDAFLIFLPFQNYQQRMTYYACFQHGIHFAVTPYTRLLQSIKHYRPTYLIGPPVLYETLEQVSRTMAGPNAEHTRVGQRLGELTGGRVRYLVTGMAPIKRTTLDFFWSHDIPLYEAYGITEAGMVAWNKPGCYRVGTLGKPAEPGTVSLSDEGEVVVKRAKPLSLGYFEADEEDRKRTFIAENTVATGDIARFDEDGFLRIIGRKKDAIITRNGEKFHPEEIESLLQRCQAVRLAVVQSDQEALGLSAIIVPAGALSDASHQQLILEHVKGANQDLPVFKKVKRVLFTDRDFTPQTGLRTHNLKLDRRNIRQTFEEDMKRAIPC